MKTVTAIATATPESTSPAPPPPPPPPSSPHDDIHYGENDDREAMNNKACTSKPKHNTLSKIVVGIVNLESHNERSSRTLNLKR